MSEKSNKNKASIRIALDEEMKEALVFLRETRYPFLKDDAIFKLAFSQLFSGTSVVSNKQTNVTTLMSKLKKYSPNYGKDWLDKKKMKVGDMTVEDFCEMIVFYFENTK